MVPKPNGLVPMLLLFFAVIAGMVSAVFLNDHYHVWWPVAPVIVLPVATLFFWGWRCRNNPVKPVLDDDEFINRQRFLQESAGKPKDGLVCLFCGKELDVSSGPLQCCGRWQDVRLVPSRGMCLVEIPPPEWRPEVGLDG